MMLNEQATTKSARRKRYLSQMLRMDWSEIVTQFEGLTRYQVKEKVDSRLGIAGTDREILKCRFYLMGEGFGYD